jgi:hypothetical protein
MTGCSPPPFLVCVVLAPTPRSVWIWAARSDKDVVASAPLILFFTVVNVLNVTNCYKSGLDNGTKGAVLPDFLFGF